MGVDRCRIRTLSYIKLFIIVLRLLYLIEGLTGLCFFVFRDGAVRVRVIFRFVSNLKSGEGVGSGFAVSVSGMGGRFVRLNPLLSTRPLALNSSHAEIAYSSHVVLE